MNRIYFDYNAATPVDPSVASRIYSSLKDVFGNPSSLHFEGRRARQVLDDARDETAGFLKCLSSELIFTGSGSESNNTAIKGVAEAYVKKGKHLVTTAVEHSSVLNTFKYMESRGWEVTYIKVDGGGMPDLNELASSIRDDTTLVSMMMANNETGVILPVKEASAISKEKGVVFHTDAVQAVGKIDFDLNELDVDLLSMAGHKFYAPKGAGALYVRKGVLIEPFIHGGSQELGRRGGTENIAAILGFQLALRELKNSSVDEMIRVGKLKNAVITGIRELINDVEFIGDKTNRLISGDLSEVPHLETLPNTVCASFKGVSGESLLIALDMEGIAVSAGSACTSGALGRSHVLSAMGLEEEVIEGAVRISLGRWNTMEEVDLFLQILPTIIKRLRSEG